MNFVVVLYKLRMSAVAYQKYSYLLIFSSNLYVHVIFTAAQIFLILMNLINISVH